LRLRTYEPCEPARLVFRSAHLLATAMRAKLALDITFAAQGFAFRHRLNDGNVGRRGAPPWCSTVIFRRFEKRLILKDGSGGGPTTFVLALHGCEERYLIVACTVITDVPEAVGP
jgi:hypothetical protein